MTVKYCIANPKPASLIESLRSIGYDLPTAIADIVDNSIAASARNIWIELHWAGSGSWICTMDDGSGMGESELTESMVPGSRSPLEARSSRDLGRFGLGLKTASFSQARCLTVISGKNASDINVRTWDLDYVEKVNEWRLLTDMTEEAKPWLEKIKERKKGSAVLWTNLDRLTSVSTVIDEVAHNRFNDSIDHVRDYMRLIFHRFLEEGLLTIHINGEKIAPWNPFLERHSATYMTPVEPIPYGSHKIIFRGYVLPHKDYLNEQEFSNAAGLYGWTAHQGFYIYRNKRLLVFGDWLRLGIPNAWSRDEQYKLARIRLEITNETDADWHLDVKKSKATPPAEIRPRLTELAANVRSIARSVFAHRGKYGPRKPGTQEIERPWVSVMRNGSRVYKVNRDHPVIQSILNKCDANLIEVEALIRILEETVPVEQIWLDTAEQKQDHTIPYDGVDTALLRADLRMAYQMFIGAGINEETARQRLLNLEPFNRYPKLIGEL